MTRGLGKKLKIALFGLLLSITTFASEIIVLETFYPDSLYSFSNPYNDFASAISPTGDFIALYAVTTEGWYPTYYLKQYPISGPAQQYRVGAFYGPTGGGWFSPRICGFEGEKILIQEKLVSDIEPYSSYKLTLLDLSPTHEHSAMYHGLVYDSNIYRTWKTDSTHASSFSLDWSNWDGPMLRFTNNYTLYPEMWWEDSTYIMDGDTLFEIENVGLVTPSKLKGQKYYCALYELEGIENRHFVCLDSLSAIAQMDNVLSGANARYIIQSRGSSFWIFQKVPGEQSIIRWSFDTANGDTAYTTIYEAEPGANEYLGQFLITLIDDAIVLQFPIVADTTRYEVSNWQSLIQKQIDMNTLAVQEIDTVFVFEPGTDHIRTSLTTDGTSPHSLIATRTPEYSRLYYYGALDLVGVKAVPPTLPRQLSIDSAFPNPFNARISIKCSLPVNSSPATLDVFDLMGRLVWSQQVNSSIMIYWDTRTLRSSRAESGIYILRFSDGVNVDTEKIMLLK